MIFVYALGQLKTGSTEILCVVSSVSKDILPPKNFDSMLIKRMCIVIPRASIYTRKTG